MLELLLYCHMFAKLRYAGEIAVVSDAVMAIVGRSKARYGQCLGPAVQSRNAPASTFGFWTEQDLGQALDRLNAYVASAA
ncbi:MAG TPA: hypothetical protein VHU22_23365 [Xanthobacteraceae bacterium]|jgi:hypothetical protein|nr:hypothetical protein [Xanthobacteraceae bacterium]